MKDLKDFLMEISNTKGHPICEECGKEMIYNDGWWICQSCNIGYEIDKDEW